MNGTNDWADDQMIDTEPLPQYELPRRLAELRDGVAAPLPNEGAARLRTIERAQHDIGQCTDVVADVDRWLNGEACVGELVPRLLRAHAKRLRREAIAKKRELRAALEARGLS